jgi:PAS domain S-box-containing protein
MALVALAYYVLAVGVLAVIPFDKHSALLWPSSGVALAALLILGPRMLPAVFVACAALGWSMEEPFGRVVAAAGLNTLYAAASWWLLTRVASFDSRLGRVQDAVAFLLAGVGATVVIKFVGSLGLGSIGYADSPGLVLESGWVAALAAGVGVLVITPPVLGVHARWKGEPGAASPDPRQVERVLFVAVAGAVALVVFDDRVLPVAAMQQMPYALFPVMFWGALRLGPMGVAAGFAAVAVIAIWCTAVGAGPYARVPQAEGLASLYLFLMILGATALTLAAALAQRKEADRLVRHSESRYRLLIERMNEGLVIHDADGVMVFVSDRFCELTGHSRGELLGRTLRDLAAPEDVGRIAEHQRSLRQGLSQSVELGLRRRDGERMAAYVSPRPMFDEQGRFVGSFALVTDVSAQRRAEEQARRHLQQLAHVSRVSSMGEMASAIAHEINQPLTAITNYAYAVVRLLRSGQGTGAEALAAMQQVAEEAERAGEVVRRMRSFVRGEEGQVSAADPAALVREVLPMVGAEARQAGVGIELDLVQDLPPVLADRIQIQQVLLNLLRNAIEAIDGANSPRRGVRVALAPAGDGFVEVQVADSGPGLPEANLAQAFAPFFTTKADGIGIGLALSRSIVDAHGGRLWAESRPGEGAVFRFTLPTVERDDD